MSTLQETRGSLNMASLSRPQLPSWGPWLVIVVATAMASLIVMLASWSWIAIPVLAVLLGIVGLPSWSAAVEGRRAAVDRLVTCLVWTSLLVALVPLVWVLAEVVIKGAPEISWSFITHDMKQELDPTTYKMVAGAGVAHALVGTLLITAAATIISVPIGLMTAVYLVEYGGGGRLARIVSFLVDVMTGIPSIVAGLFALAVLALLFGPAFRAGIGGSVALSLLMLPTVVRSAEEMFRLVPDDLREASYALGVPKWLTILRVVLPTALGGLVSGVVLAISRVVGETAPLLVVAGSVDGVNTDLFSGRMTTIPVYIYEQYSESTPIGYQNAWGGALVLLTVVVVLNLAARIIGRLLAPAGRR